MLSAEEFLVKTSLYKDEVPKVDSKFKYHKMTIHVCNRNNLRDFLHEAAKYFEIILWMTSKFDYTQQLSESIQESV